MRARTLIGLLLCIAAAMLGGAAWALDEAVLTPTPERPAHGLSAAKAEKAKADADKEFNAAMSIWFKKTNCFLRAKQANDLCMQRAGGHFGQCMGRGVFVCALACAGTGPIALACMAVCMAAYTGACYGDRGTEELACADELERDRDRCFRMPCSGP